MTNTLNEIVQGVFWLKEDVTFLLRNKNVTSALFEKYVAIVFVE
mgnify:CR=1 FL=1